MFAGEVIGVDAAQHDLAPRAVLTTRVRVPVEPEREHVLGDQALGDGVVERWGHAVDRDGVPAHAENTVEFGKEKRNAGFFGRLGEDLVLDLQPRPRHGIRR